MPGLELTGAGLRSARPSELLTRQASFPGPPPNLSCLPNTGSLPQTLNSSLNIHSRTPMPGLGVWQRTSVAFALVAHFLMGVSLNLSVPSLLGTADDGSPGVFCFCLWLTLSPRPLVFDGLCHSFSWGDFLGSSCGLLRKNSEWLHAGSSFCQTYC